MCELIFVDAAHYERLTQVIKSLGYEMAHRGPHRSEYWHHEGEKVDIVIKPMKKELNNG